MNPQPDATVVIHRLLDWMDRVDVASQHGHARPPFRTIWGEDIFPPDDELWGLTDVSRRAKDEDEQPADEDGPPSELEGNRKMRFRAVIMGAVSRRRHRILLC